MSNSSSETHCSMCKQPPFITRPYSGEVLCEQCFRASIEAKVREAISKWQMLQRTDRIAVAFSGGKDSAALLSILVENQRRFPESEIIAVTLDEGISAASDREKIVRTAAQMLGVELVISSYQELYSVTMDDLVELVRATDYPYSPCVYCGVMRRQGLNILARQLDADKLAFGHCLDDEVQSMLMNLIRGDVQRLSRLEVPADYLDIIFFSRGECN
ncbi:MAG: ATP-binding protein, partial [Promethearchaeota archaeon]